MSITSVMEPAAAEDYLAAAEALMRFIDTRKQEGPDQSVYWSLRDAAEGRDIYYDEISMYAGASGIICFLLALYETVGREAYLDEAEAAGGYLIWRLHNQPALRRNFSPYAFSSGWSGAGFALIQLYLATGKERYLDAVEEIVSRIMENAVSADGGQGYFWSDYPGIVGDAGTVLFLLYAAERCGRKEWREFALSAGRILPGSGRDMEAGRYYSGVNPAYFGGGADYVDPNFPMGTAGIGYTMLRLYEAGGDPIFLESVKGIPEYMDFVAVNAREKTDSGVMPQLLPHALPGHPRLFYLGYCHGPAGTCRFYYQLYKTTGDPRYRQKLEQLKAGLLLAGAPEVRSAGYWHNYNMCCGTAGILNLFLGLWADGGSEEDLQLARRCGRVLLGGMTCEEKPEGLSARVYLALDRIAPQKITSPIGFMDGAAGIGAMLLQLYSAETGKFHALRAVDDPFPERLTR